MIIQQRMLQLLIFNVSFVNYILKFIIFRPKKVMMNQPRSPIKDRRFIENDPLRIHSDPAVLALKKLESGEVIMTTFWHRNLNHNAAFFLSIQFHPQTNCRFASAVCCLDNIIFAINNFDDTFASCTFTFNIFLIAFWSTAFCQLVCWAMGSKDEFESDKSVF